MASQKTRAQLAADIEELTATNAGLSAEVEELKGAVVDGGQGVDDLKAARKELASTKGKLTKVSKALEAAKAEVGEPTKVEDNAVFKRQANELKAANARIKTLGSDIDILGGKLTTAESQLKKAKRQLADAGMMNDADSLRHKRLAQEIVTLKNSAAAARKIRNILIGALVALALLAAGGVFAW